MKAKLIFDLSNPDDTLEFKRVNKSLFMACALFDIVQLRKSCTNEFDYSASKDVDVFDGIDRMAEKIANILEKYSINIEELIQ